MADIPALVERLRAHGGHFGEEGPTGLELDAAAALLTLQAERDEARGCPNGENCACAIGSRHFWLESFSQEREKREQAEATIATRDMRIAELGAERDRLKAALEAVEWVEADDGREPTCLWCGGVRPDRWALYRYGVCGHAPYCPRQAALGALGESAKTPAKGSCSHGRETA